jgi:HlyD family secretion protein
MFSLSLFEERAGILPRVLTMTRKRITLGGVLLVCAVLIAVALRPAPITVETAQVQQGPLRVTIDEEGETRVHDRFVIAAPVNGRLARIELRDGDPVEVNQILATIAPLPLSAREREEQLAHVAAAEARQRAAEEQVRHVQAEFEQARRDRVRAEELLKEGFATQQTVERARVAEATRTKELSAAQFRARAAAADVQQARAGLLALETANGKDANLVFVRSPVTGQVLRIVEKSERVVTAGAPLLTVGDPALLEVVVDVLSTDAVKIKPGMPVWLEDWGGERSLRAQVRTVEPSAFTKISALGVEEQRVNVVADFVDSPNPLGDGYRVEVRIVVWERDAVLKIPTSALFRRGQQWSVFTVENGKAWLRMVEVGQRNALEAEILSGLSAGDEIIG